ncbi:DsbA family protein [Sanguibacter massiliensis]|uniref:DsbA family protein n=1 Tax=Sanguibacter massiliensis TaxID=1973217 RepID=UPI000C85F5AC|nr:thioredoxin domain-containing protein [Sanguibacter massiliensis]
MSSKKSAPAQSRDAARNLAATMRAEQAAREKRVKIITISAFGVAVAALVAAIIWAVIASRPVELPEPAPLATPSVVNADGGISVGKDGAAGTVNEGAPVMDLYLDFMCVWCGVFEETNGALVKQWREAGDVTVVYHPVAILDHLSQGTAFSTRSATAAFWIAEKAPAQFDAFIAAMFAAQPDEKTKGLTDREIADIAKSAGVPAEVADGIAAQDAYKAHAAWVAAQTGTVGKNEKLWTDFPDGRRGFSTPTIVIGGEKFEGNWQTPGALRAAVDAAATNG